MSAKSGYCLSLGKVYHDQCNGRVFVSIDKGFVDCECTCGHANTGLPEAAKAPAHKVVYREKPSTPSPKPRLKKRRPRRTP